MSCSRRRSRSAPLGVSFDSPGPGADVVPVAEAVGDDVVSRPCSEIGDVALHAVVVPVEQRVAVHLVGVPGTITQALPHSGESRKPPVNTVYSGAMSGTRPLSSWDSRMSQTILRRGAARRS